MVAGLHVIDGLAHFLDDSGGFMAEDRGRGKGIVAVDEVQVAMANAAGDGAHQDFAILRLVDLDVLDNQRLIGTIEHGGLHCCGPPEKFCGEPRTRGTASHTAAAPAVLPGAHCMPELLLLVLPDSIPQARFR